MAEQPQEQPQEPPQEQPGEGSGGGGPKIFNKLNTMIAGVTGLVIAMGGLAATWDKMFGGKPAEEQAATAQPETLADATPAAEEQAVEEPAAEDPSYYDIDEGGTLRWIDGLWVEKTGNGTFRYEQVSNDGYKTVAVDRGGGENGEDVWLRWDTAGGQAQKSFDRQATWEDVFNVYVPEES